jgi:putative effector of murein hydrolase
VLDSLQIKVKDVIEYLIGSGVTIAIFAVCRYVYKIWRSALLNPVLMTIIIVCLSLVIFDLEYREYKLATSPISFFLEVAVVTLAYPLYMQFNDIKGSFIVLLVSSFIGISLSTLCAFFLCWSFNASTELTASLAALSVTTPISLIVTENLNGLSSIAAIMVILIGIFGGVFGLSILSLFSQHSYRAKGIALGVSCHAIGTAAAIEHHPTTGVFASAAMTMSALLTALWVPILYRWLTQVTSIVI